MSGNADFDGKWDIGERAIVSIMLEYFSSDSVGGGPNGGFQRELVKFLITRISRKPGERWNHDSPYAIAVLRDGYNLQSYLDPKTTECGVWSILQECGRIAKINEHYQGMK